MINVVFILDETGSMQVRKKETVDSFNEYIEKLKEHKNIKKVRFTLVRFNSSKLDIYYDKVKLNKVNKLEDYKPDDATPLYDVIGKTINSIDSDKCIMAILTDGQENMSLEFKYRDIVEMIQDKTKLGWEFIFLATGIDDMDASAVASAGAGLGFTTRHSSKKVGDLYNVFYGSTIAYIDDKTDEE
jgi:Mg-chelatase subunit ChlD